jgi:hypothetical protein
MKVIEKIRNREIFSQQLVIRYLHFARVLSRSFPAPINAGRFPFAQNLVKFSHSLNRLPRKDFPISYVMQ